MSSCVCKNCTHHYTGHYCPQCGQSSHVERIDAHYFLHDIPHSVFHIDKGFWFTFRKLLTNPGDSLAEYLAGKRVDHFRPFAYVLIMSAIYVFAAPQLENLGEWVIGKDIYKPYGSRPFLEKYISVLIFILIPILSIFTWISFKKAAYNYWEHFLINTYMAAQINLLLLGLKLWGVLKITIGWGVKVNFTLAMFLFMFYYSFTFVKLMKPHYPRIAITLRLLMMNFFLSLTYMTGFSVSGIMEPWWGK